MFRRATVASAMVVLASWLCVNPSAAQDACSGPNCAQLTVTHGAIAGGNVPVTVTYTQGLDDGQAGQGNDETAAIAFTLGIPGVGSSTPLTLSDPDCVVNSDGLTSAFTIPDVIKNTFKVVIENLKCTTTGGTPRTRCLCPDAGQQRDNFINVVVYGPKDLPTTGPVNIPVLPSGPLLTVNLHMDSTGKTDLHVFSEVDSQSTSPKPQFGAFLSIGDKAAIDQTFDRDANKSKVKITNDSVGMGGCVGDCDGEGHVAVDELVKGVNIALANADVSTCPAFDPDNSGTVTVDELVQGVNNALGGCQ